MNLSSSTYALRKRWRLTLTLFVLAGILVVAAAVAYPKSYASNAQVVFVTSQISSKGSANNPYLDFGSSLFATADVVARKTMDPRLVASLASRGYGSSYQVEDAPNSPSPVLIVTVTGSKPSEVQSTLNTVVTTIAGQLNSLQSGLVPQDRITDMVLSSSTDPTLSLSKMARPIAAVVVLAGLVAFSIPIIVEGMAVRRRKTKNRPDKSAHGSGDDSYTQQRDDVYAPKGPYQDDVYPPKGPFQDDVYERRRRELGDEAPRAASHSRTRPGY